MKKTIIKWTAKNVTRKKPQELLFDFFFWVISFGAFKLCQLYFRHEKYKMILPTKSLTLTLKRTDDTTNCIQQNMKWFCCTCFSACIDRCGTANENFDFRFLMYSSENSILTTIDLSIFIRAFTKYVRLIYVSLTNVSNKLWNELNE